MAINATLRLKRVNGKLTSGAPTVPRSKKFLLNPIYRVMKIFDFEITSHKSQLTVKPYEYASSNHLYRWLCAAVGGIPPYRWWIEGGFPDGMAFVGGLRVQEYERTYDGSIGKTKHVRPDNFGELQWQCTPEQLGETYRYRICCQDQQETVRVVEAQITGNNAVFKYLAGTGSDAANGAFATPWQHLSAAYTFPNIQNFVVCYKDGTYAVNNGTPGQNASLGVIKTHMSIGNAVFDTSGGVFQGAANDITFYGMQWDGGNVNRENDTKPIKTDGRTDRLTVVGNTFRNMSKGLTGDNNPACVFMIDTDGNYHQDLVFCNNTNEASSVISIINTFSTMRPCVEGNRDLNVTGDLSAFYFKDSPNKLQCLHNYAKRPFRFDNQDANNSNQQMCAYNLMVAETNANVNTVGIPLNNQPSGTTTGLRDIYVQHCTVVMKIADRPAITSRKQNAANAVPTVSGVAWYSTRTPMVVASELTPAYTDGGDNRLFALSDFDANYDLQGAAKAYAGLSGHSIYSD